MLVNKLFLVFVIVGMICMPCIAENTIEPFSVEWIELYQSGTDFPDICNDKYYVLDGVLFQENILVAYPRGKSDKQYYVPDGTEMIASCAFDGNEFIEKVVLPSSITCIGDGAFVGCTKLQEINLPDRLLVIGSTAFAQCYSLKNIVLPSHLYVIGDQAFCDVTMLKGTFIIPPSVKYIGDELLCYTNITTIVFEGCVYHLGHSLIGVPKSTEYYEIQVPDLCFSFAEVLQEEYADFDNVIVLETISEHGNIGDSSLC